MILSICLNAGASLLLKLSTGYDGSRRMLVIGSSMVCYAVAFLTYSVCLRNLPVSVAYPVITGGAILAIVIMAALLLNEQLTTDKMIGAGLVIAGGALLLRQ